jgi:hypothetical protein
MYKLYTDKTENFVADVSVKNASLKNSVARLVIETDDVNLVFKGTIEEQKCIVPIKKLKGILTENTHGKMYLEIIVEDIYFKPWESDFVVDEHTSMKVVVQEQVETKKPVLEVRVEEKPVLTEAVQAAPKEKPKVIKEVKMTPAQEITFICERVGITKKNFSKDIVVNVLKEYFNENPQLENNKIAIIKEFYKNIGPAMDKK